jgi:predicted regulator of Ras-like GTPase activity (Roadblock/LC7/MglB family)
MEKRKELELILQDLEKVGDVIGSAIIRRDGLIIVSGLPAEVNSKAVAAMAAAMVGTGETASKELNIGGLNQVIVESKNGKLISVGAGEEAVITALIREKANMGLVLLEMDKASKKIARLL